jgi:hypothetical protein
MAYLIVNPLKLLGSHLLICHFDQREKSIPTPSSPHAVELAPADIGRGGDPSSFLHPTEPRENRKEKFPPTPTRHRPLDGGKKLKGRAACLPDQLSTQQGKGERMAPC